VLGNLKLESCFATHIYIKLSYTKVGGKASSAYASAVLSL
jgi:hypothetical protein